MTFLWNINAKLQTLFLASQTFKLQEGTSYKYNFDSKVEISLSSAEGQKSVTEVRATVLLTQQPQCNQVLKLQNVQIISSDGKVDLIHFYNFSLILSFFYRNISIFQT